jgi:glycosyltransferase involved in cell wall biosynthesis
MKILFVVPYVPNPIRVRPYEFLRALVARKHTVTVATVWTSDAERKDLERLRTMGVRVLAEPMPSWRSATNSLLVVPSSTPLQAVYSWQPALFKAIWELVATELFDAVHIEHLRGSRYGLELLQRLQQLPERPPVVWDSVDCISYLFAQAARSSRSLKGKMMTRLELGRTERYEASLVERFDRTAVTSRLDKEALVELAQRYGQGVKATQIEIVPNGVDFEHFSFRPNTGRPRNRIVFSGKMSYHANVTAALHLVNDIMPRVWAQQPSAEVWIVGKDPARELTALATPASADSAAPRRVVVTGAVQEMEKYIQDSTIAAAPLLYGAGIQNKVIEAMACGTPVVTSPQASQALAAKPGVELLVAEDPERFADAILELLQSPERCTALGKAGRAFVEQHHSWDSAAQHLERVYASCAEQLLVKQA